MTFSLFAMVLTFFYSPSTHKECDTLMVVEMAGSEQDMRRSRGMEEGAYP